MIAVQLIIVAGIILWIRFLWNRRKLYMLMWKLPGSMGLPFIGIAANYFLFYKRKMSIRTKYMDKNGSTILTWMGTLPIIMTRDPKVAEDVYMAPLCINRNLHSTKAMALCMGSGLVTLQGDKWLERRKQMTPAFKHNVLISFLPIFNAETKTLVALLDSYVDQGEKYILPDLTRWSFRISTQTTVGTDVKEDEHFNNDLILESYQSLLRLTTLNVLIPFLQIKIISKLLGYEKQRQKDVSNVYQMFDKILDKKLNSRTEIDWKPELKTVINRTIELFRNGGIPFEEVKGECMSMVVAAFETTAETVFHTLVLLAMFPKFQDMVFHELKELFPSTGDFEVTYEDLLKMDYLERVVNETLRLIPSLPMVSRETTDDLLLSNGVIIPKGVTILIDIFNIHRNTDVWGPEAAVFNPDNFLPDRIRDKHPFAFIPFSKGKRNCIGWKYGMMSTKLALTKILRNFEVSTTFRYEDLEFVDTLIMKLAQSPPLSFQRRKS
ncbi:probable cytochrome P450 313a2 [Drosophila ficusphila]|uniref:probable cytochrome P450 313a2 n=1 Tax=Drosophila ficusphila TaxID=30025 RepID=UPI001C8907BD|nr:probable cytochrome P450 313a2 [Drosophila ficusphila]